VNPIAIVLVTASVLFHATWNVSLKEESESSAFLVSFKAASALLVLPLVLFACYHLEVFAGLLPYLLASSVCNALYYLFLLRAYRAGDFSLAYPVARSAPIFVVTLAGLFFGEHPSVVGLGGIVLVVAGCFLLPLGMHSGGGVSFRTLFSPVMGYALLTALATSGYSIFDKFGSRPAFAAFGLMGSLGYMGPEWVMTAALLAPLAWCTFRERGLLVPLTRKPGKVFLAAFLMTLSYGFVMVAYQFAQASYVVGFRQLSIVLGVILGVVTLKERVNAFRISGTIVVVAGLVMLALA